MERIVEGIVSESGAGGDGGIHSLGRRTLVAPVIGKTTHHRMMLGLDVDLAGVMERSKAGTD